MQQTTLEVPQTKVTAISTYRQMGRHKGFIWCLLFPVYSVEAYPHLKHENILRHVSSSAGRVKIVYNCISIICTKMEHHTSQDFIILTLSYTIN